MMQRFPVLMILAGAFVARATDTAAAQPRTPQQVRALLARDIKFTGYDDPKMTLQEVVDHLSKVYNVPIKVKEAAFKAERADAEVLKTEVVANPIAPRNNVTLDRVLRIVLGRISSDSGAVFIVRGNTIEITTAAALQAQRLRPEPHPKPTTAMTKRTRELKAILSNPVDFPGFDDPKTTLAEALDFLSKRHNLTFEVNERAFAVEELPEVLKSEVVAKKPLPSAKGILPRKVLESLLAGVPCASKAVFLVRPQGYIEITTGSAARKGIGLGDPGLERSADR